ncbi:FAD-dependent monooxygenase [Nocardiopsis alborubida]|uniref:FAD-dependent monooxygenase n=1 Tax=Nocardiopsis alborubida TaxID=146802 RepID=UPI001E385143|nr:FAD-dependent monooxygenase [Nocardiopsis alborubida]
MVEPVDVVVVGAGPVGLMLAGELRLGGADVVVLERLTAPIEESRASQLGPRTAELFLQRGLWEALGDPPQENTGHFGGIPLAAGGADGPVPGNRKVPQPRTERILHDWATGLGAKVLRDHEVVSVEQTADEAVLTVRTRGVTASWRARHVVGCDGAESVVRRDAGIPFDGTPAEREVLRADLKGARVSNRRFERLPRGVAVSSTSPEGVTRVMVHEYDRAPGTAPPSFAEVAAAWERVTGEDVSGATALWTDSFDDAQGQAAVYRRGRLFLAGDAARVHVPAGGQSLNTGLHDAVNLGWKLAARVHGRVGDDLLDTYDAERRRAGQRVLANVAVQNLLLFGGSRYDRMRDLFGNLLETPVFAESLADMVNGVGERYPAPHERPDDPLLGRRLPPCPKPRGTAFLPPDRGVLLLDSDGPLARASREGAAPWVDRVDVIDERDLVGLLPSPVRAALVRPDGHVAWTDRCDRSLGDALHRWFGPPGHAPEGLSDVREGM